MKKSAYFLRRGPALSLAKGFTLVELLVVIAIIGVLAAVLLIGINPVEQINKAKDAGKLSRAKELVSAAERYYTAFGTSSSFTEPTCAVLASTAVAELKSTACGSGTGATSTVVVLVGTAGNYTATFTAESKTYKAKCGSSTCTVPTNF